ncbi:hypothetical protein A2154_02460 [Candidatus Gottesmanbacteria bacterium RBG_16_43_7]|uniref:Carbohydrate kinase PfkB domain-containing protein n=1 Tax=Candidatus Gottesmanbacteria bacterium RBG_16_43_7 TaxID=1798373 RepID=A0A1F5ZBS8_9BACT|nr:MAG: hypothetical protein A2154_02460 [Candidatus Gottesmanbacteria bacterium RBG_16_43_7]
MRIIVTGTLSYDYIMDFPGRFADRIMPDKIHTISLSFLVDRLHKQLGGTAGNIAYTLTLLGCDARIVSVAGNDFGPYKQFLKSHHIDISQIVEIRRVPTSSYFVITDRDNNQIGSFYLGATKFAKTLSIAQALISDKKIQHEPFIVISPTDPAAMMQYTAECIEHKFKYLYDPAFQVDLISPEGMTDAVSHAQILIGNDYEITLIEKKLAVSHEELILMVPVLVTTLGAQGSVVETPSQAIHIKPAKPASGSDPTGAGDAYRAGFLAGYTRGLDLITCAQIGSTAAVYTVEKYGTMTHSFTRSDFIIRYRENYGTDLRL